MKVPILLFELVPSAVTVYFNRINTAQNVKSKWYMKRKDISSYE
ncbi:hypothetical protein ACPV3A_28420 [Paenibacillus sp. Dod16]